MAKVLSEGDKTTLSMLISSYEMLQKSREATANNSKSKNGALKQIDDAINDNLKQIAQIDKETAERLKNGEKVQAKKKAIQQDLFDDDENEMFSILSNNSMNNDEGSISIEDIMNDDDSETTEDETVEPEETEEDVDEEVEEESTVEEAVEAKSSMFNDIDPSMQYDIIELPSNGQPYKDKTDRLPVGFLTAYDENFITSPNLYKDGMVIDFLLKKKVLSKDFNIDDLVTGDVDAIILWLRATSYGYEFPVTVKDPETGENIDYTVDLSTLKPKEFNLVADENGWFDFTLPLTKKVVKFRYLTRKMEKQLKKISELEGYGTKASLLEQDMRSITAALVGDNLVNEQDRKTVQKATKVIQSWVEKLKKKQSNTFNKFITNMLQMQVMSIDGITDRAKIKDMIANMPARDALELRRYINKNTPGINFEVDIERPESMGGGSFKTFLNWDDSVFLNLPQLREDS